LREAASEDQKPGSAAEEIQQPNFVEVGHDLLI
jgi:hypothetical protein